MYSHKEQEESGQRYVHFLRGLLCLEKEQETFLFGSLLGHFNTENKNLFLLNSICFVFCQLNNPLTCNEAKKYSVIKKNHILIFCAWLTEKHSKALQQAPQSPAAED